MLVSIECDKFPESHRVITFSPGLNSIIGTDTGSNAIGKSTFLRIIDFVFGGDSYLKEEEIIREVGHHDIYFSFQFDGKTPLYFCRTTSDPCNVVSLDSNRHPIEKKAVSRFQRELMDNYGTSYYGVTLSDIQDHFFRIYRKLNVLEQYPVNAKPSEQPDTTVNFLMKLFGHSDELFNLQRAAKELHIDVSKMSNEPQKTVSLDEIEELQTTIDSLTKRLTERMQENEVAQTQLFGYNPRAMEQADKIRKELTSLSAQQSKLRSQLSAIQRSMDAQAYDTAEDFEDLQTFFPEITMKKFEAIEGFHGKIREILLGELGKEELRLKSLLGRCDQEIKRMQHKLESTGTAKQMSTQIISECAGLMNTIAKYKDEQNALIEERNQQMERASAKKQIRDLLDKERKALKSIETDLNDTMAEINTMLTGEGERAPSIHIKRDKAFTFGVKGNSSEGAAFRSMVIYDLAAMKLCNIPALIHDSNILKKIDDHQLEHLINLYQNSGHQIFVAYDRLSAATQVARSKLSECAALELSEDDLLFGVAWSKEKTGGNA